MTYTQQDFSLILSIIAEDVERFISAFERKASLVDESDIPRFSANPTIQAMIDFGIATDKRNVDRSISAAILQKKPSPVQLGILSCYNSDDLTATLKNWKENASPKPNKYRGL